MSKIIYSDGCCINNGLVNAVASWSFVVTDMENNPIEASTGRVEGAQDNNRAELIAFIRALEYVRNRRNEEFIMHVDYEALYLYCNGMSRPKANLDLYRQINYILGVVRDRVTVKKVKAHKTQNSIANFFNGIVDKLARKSQSIFCTGGVALGAV